jgi:hypothetical protein
MALSTTASETNVIVVIGEPSSSKSVVSEWWFWVAIVGGGLVCCAAVALVVLVMRRRKKRDASPASAESAEVAASASGPASHIYGSFVGVQTVNGDSGAVPERDPIEYSAFTITDEEQNQQIKVRRQAPRAFFTNNSGRTCTQHSSSQPTNNRSRALTFRKAHTIIYHLYQQKPTLFTGFSHSFLLCRLPDSSLFLIVSLSCCCQSKHDC